MTTIFMSVHPFPSIFFRYEYMPAKAVAFVNKIIKK